ncbi:hypothetical protein [Mycolicibacterium monacense]|uniref:Sensor domain-containing protein n=2 Tax=Mycobacteriaceae TaxID=1762 RepID=A0AAD1IWY4_MYCMB|nr:hypothetical protein [Mycolicibacterium monacense]MDA4104954.1 hypothetical protein [Mycolicibacterium monacense DSM 44395]ORB23869.1 hypothetical protein BST34_02360 [Mycolicibacterium monacense DSM 44395]QHP85870.1 hypothetical protein EWR22_11060 [Mycolicibacterium monacense DSM 44395]BBZ61205.1 hypothetical protein MMON_25060 [Mycolicibacterium monacense]
MTAMDGVLVRGASGAVVALAGVLLCGCVRVTDGTASLAADAKPVVLADALLEPLRFPPAYRAAVLDPQATGEAVAAVEGVPVGAAVEPPGCAPPRVGPGPEHAVAAQGVDSATGAALTVILTRTDTALSARRDQIARCAALTATAGEVVSTVDTVLLAPPPVDADESLASEATILRSTEPAVRVLTLSAQIDEARLTVAWLNNDPAVEPDTSALDVLFTDALLTLRRAAR